VSDPILVPCLVALRSEFNRKYPGRDKGADGWIGDAAHQQESSDHNPDESGRTPTEDADKINEVHALDVDANVKPGASGPIALAADVEHIRLAHQRGDDDRLQNVIYRGKIASRSWGWGWRDYDGASQHYDHAHFSARYDTSREQNTKPWGVDVQLEQADINKIVNAVVAVLRPEINAVADEVWAAAIGPVLPSGGRRSAGGSLNALVVPTGDPSTSVPNIITREVKPLIDAAVAALQAPAGPPTA
jgi:hypothetical protein